MTRTVAIVIGAIAVLGLTAMTGLAQRESPPDLGSSVVVPAGDDSGRDDGTAGQDGDAPVRRAEESPELTTEDRDDGDDEAGEVNRGQDDSRAPWVTDARVDEPPPPPPPDGSGAATAGTMGADDADEGGDDSGDDRDDSGGDD